MNENNNRPTDDAAVDGFSDTEGSTTVGSPDPGSEGALEPLSPEERARLEKEIREGDGADDLKK